MNSNNRAFLNTLHQMKGKAYTYGGKVHTLKDYSIDDVRERVTIQTNLRSFDRNYGNVAEFLTYWVPVQAEEPQQENPVREPEKAVVVQHTSVASTDGVYEQHQATTNDLIAILKENIDKVRKSKEYIPQAQSINNNVNSIINIQKLQLDVYKQFKSKK